MPGLTCPRCGRGFVRRSEREGVVEQLLSMAYVYPFRCQYCDHRFRSLQWGVRYVKRRRERREYERLPVQLSGRLATPSWSAAARVTDLSINGCTVETDAPLQPGAVVGLELDVAPAGPPVAVERAMVRSTHRAGAGLAFLRFAPAQRERLREVVLDLMEKRAGR